MSPTLCFSVGLRNISSSDAGRTEDTTMHKNRVGQKREIKLQWNGVHPDVTSKVLKLFNLEYFEYTYWNPLDNAIETRTFYRGDADANLYAWTNGGLYESVGFTIIER